MITRVQARNFLSLKEIELRLGPRVVLVGANMSGKSNFLECLKFVKDANDPQQFGVGNPLGHACGERGGLSEVGWKGQPQGPSGLSLDAELPSSNGIPATYHYEVSFRQNEYGPFVDLERLSIEKSGK